MTKLNRKPRIALMGEFSAGKSTLSNLLLGARPLPEKVTATRLSPVWMSHGTDAPYRVDVDGREEQITLDDLDNIDVEATRVVRLFFESDVLEICDLIDFPGISDPNMSSDVWQRMLEEVDVILWCTHATQAWRQSEAAVWETIPAEVRERSVLLVTRFDKLTTKRDKYRVMARLNQETEGLFAATFPISLTDALAAKDDYELFESSGGLAFLEYFVEMTGSLTADVADNDQTLFAAHHVEKPAVAPAPQNTIAAVETPEVDLSLISSTLETSDTPSAPERAPTSVVEPLQLVPDAPKPEDAVEGRIMPRRVRSKGGARRPRPTDADKTLEMAEAPSIETDGSSSATPGQLDDIFREGPA